MKKTLIRLLKREEQGQVLVLALILLAVGSLIITPLVVFMGTGLLAAQIVEEKANELYAADAGIEDAVQRIMADSFGSLDINDTSLPYTLTEQINGLTVTYTVTKLSLIAGFIGEGEYKVGQPHEDWVSFSAPAEAERTDEFVTYTCGASFHYEGNGNRRVETLGAFFSPWPGSESLIDGPNNVGYTPVMTDAFLEVGSPELEVGAGSFAFIWRWENNKGPEYDKDNPDGAIIFEFTVWDPNWEIASYFIWATFKEQDISYVTNANMHNWLVEATAGDTTVISYIVGGAGQANILSFELN